MKRFLSRTLKKFSKKILLAILTLIIISAPLLYLTVLNSKSTSAAWYSDNWYFRKKLTIDSTKVSSGPHAYFPVMVSIADTSLKKAQSTGNDILFTSSDGTTQLNHEIEKFDSTTGTLIAWVTIPSLVSTADTIIYMYYGNSNTTSQQNSANTWNENSANNYKGVWHLKENPASSAPQMVDSTSNGYNGTSNGSMTASQQITGKVDGNLNFDGNDDYIDAGDQSNLNATTSFTVEAWINRSGNSNLGSAGNITSKSGGWWLDLYDNNTLIGNNSNNLRFVVLGASSNSLFSNATITNNTWYHVVTVYDGGHKYIYINGALDNSDVATGTPTNSASNFRIGRQTTSNGADNAFNGQIDEVRFSSTARSAGWIATEYNNQNSPSTFFKTIASEEKIKNPVLYWKFEEGQGPTAYDSGSQRLNGTITGADWKEKGLCVFGKCLYFDGVGANNDNVSAADNSSLDFDTSSFSLSAWVKYSGAASAQSLIFAKAENVTYTGYKLYMDASGDFCFDDGDGTNSDSACTSGVDFDDNNWHQVTGVKTGTSKLELFVDGKLRATDGSIAATATLSNANPFYVGIDQDGISNEWKGFIDEVKVYDYVRTAAQVKTDYASRGSVKGVSAQMGGADQNYLSNGLVGYWKMDESSVGVGASDYSGNGITLTNTNSATYTAGKFGNAGTFASASSQYQYAASATSSPLTVTGDLTLSSWIKPTSNTAATQYDITGKWDGANTSYLLAQYGDEIRLYLNSSSNYVTTNTANLATGTWYHIIATYSAKDQSVKIFVNGVQQAATTTGTIPSSINSNAGNFFVGAQTSSLDYQVGASADDGRWFSSPNAFFDSTSANGFGTMGYQDASYPNGNTFARFTGVTIPAGSTINTAYLSFDSGSNDSGSVALNISAVKEANPAAPISVVDADGRTLTGTVAWAPGGWSAATWYNTVSIVSVVQELVNTYSYSAGSAMLYYVKDNNSTGQRTALLYDYTTVPVVDAPKLHIEYTGNYYNGSLDEVRVYNRALSPKEVSDLYNWAPGPTGEWRLDEGTGNSTKDTSAIGGNNGTLVNNTAWALGKLGKALSFDGNDDYVNLGGNSLFDITGAKTVSAWVKVNGSANNNNRIFSKREDLGGGESTGYELIINPSTCLITFAHIGVSPNVTATATGCNNTWKYISAVYTGTVGQIYINGILANSDTFAVASSNSSPALLGICGGEYNDGASGCDFNGQIDQVSVYNYARTQKQIVSDMNGGHPAVGSPVGSSVAYWKFDEGYGTTAHDSTPNNKSLTLSSASWINSGKFGKAWNGTGALWLSRADDNDLDFVAADDLSLSLWFKSDVDATPGTGEYLIQKVSTAGYSIYSNTSGNILFASTDGTNTDTVTSTSNLYDNTWHHILAEKTGTSRLDLYIDGKLNASNTSLTNTSTLANAGLLYLGDKDGINNGDEFNGDLDEVKVYRYALTADEVKTEYNRGSSLVLGAAGNSSTYQAQAANQEYCVPGDTTSCAAPVGEWKFEEKTGITANDTSGNNYNGTLTQGPSWTTGKYGGGLKFDGVDDYVTAGDISSQDWSSLTVSAWIYWDGFTEGGGSYTGVWGKGSTADIGRFLVQASGKVLVQNGNGNFFSNNDGDVASNQWQHIVYKYDQSAGQEYIIVNGVVKGQQARTGNITQNTNSFVFGKEDADIYHFRGKIDEVKIYNYARTPAQIAWDYNRGKPVGWWKMDECQGTTIHDSSGNNYSGTWAAGTTYTSAGTCSDGLSSSAWYGGRNGKFNGSLDFDGTATNRVTIGTAINGVQSVSFWVKPTTNTDSFMDLDGGTHYITASSGTVSATGFSTPTIYVNGVSGGAVTAGAWNHIVVTTATSFNTTTSFTLGYKSAATADYLTGQLDDVRIYNYALTATQIKDVYNNGAVFFGPSTGTP
ncbi:DUF2341 domain-containing protein [Patescibacteria group bacterium]|nr:DUF2341 domain-containing protein [Patescibacteria group bacterium]